MTRVTVLPLEVVRTGGTQYVFSVDYKTISGTAIAGVDFANTSGTLLFNCGEERATIEIPLINDKNEDESMDLSFWVSSPIQRAEILRGWRRG